MIIEFANKTPAWCPGCGDYSILEILKNVFKEANYDPHKFVLVSGIGQAAKLPHYIDANVFNGLHGRALPEATGIKIANHKLEVIITSGDGDMYSEGGNHFLHAIRRNIGVKAFVHNNQVYGLTKGQASPTSDPGFVTPIQTHGVKSAPVNPLTLAIIEECSFVARSFSGNQEHLAKMMKAAIEHKHGFALLDILQPCVSFNHHNTFAWYKKRVREISPSHDPHDKMKALELAMKWGDEIPIGIFYKNKRKSFEADNEVLQKGTLVDSY
ncbi:MAG: 2-oxoacid:ferredoxin oxidoreductase subunit beta [Lentisphaerae bacterium]|nr:2-oxoacid:ferredoxin oxidoreductase subunit beta [Lentisphaerota bacterium]MCP4101637.1 2-oxoacid:ferredoxin oxidoreductase subunit beta [Lentisphaerota bacterium]